MLKHLSAAVCFGLAAALAGSARGDDLAKVEGSIHKVPADVAFYSSSLRIGEQVDAFLKSRAYAKLRSLPAAKAAYAKMKEEAQKPGNPLGQILAFFRAPENKELGDALLDAVRHEFFAYGSDRSVKFLSLAAEINGAVQFAPLMNKIGGGDKSDQEAQVEALFEALKENLNNIVVPDMTIGLRTTKGEVLRGQLERLEKHLQHGLEKAPPPLRDRLKRSKVAGADVLAYTLDGTLVPWDKVEIDKDEYKEVIEKLKGLKLVVSLAVKDDYVLIGLGGDTSHLARFGAGSAVASRPELAPLAKFADRRLVGVDYFSKDLAAATTSSAQDLTDMVDAAKDALKEAPLSDKLKEAIAKDLDAAGKELAGVLPAPAPSVSFAFMTDRGTEGYSFTYSETPARAPKPLSILQNLGGTPLAVVAESSGDPTPAYKTMSKWARVFFRHAEAAVEELAPENIAQQFKTGMEQVRPFLKRFDEITGNQLLPSLSDGETAMVVDAKWTSKQWFPGFDQNDKELPMIELGVVCSVADAGKLVKAGAAYRELVNDALNLAREHGAPIPEGGWPAPETKKAGGATLYFWPVPQMGQDESVQPNIGVSEKLLTFTLSQQHAERLHKLSPLAGDLRRLAGGKSVTAAAAVDFDGMLRAAWPWFETFAVPAMEADTPEDGPPGLRRADVAPQAKTVYEVLRCIKGMRTVTYREGNATVTHFEAVVEDLKD
jgi:hypothetical protein